MGTSIPPLLDEIVRSVPGATKAGQNQRTKTFNKSGAKDQYSVGEQIGRLIDSLTPGFPTLFRLISKNVTKCSEQYEAWRKREIGKARAMYEGCGCNDPNCDKAIKRLYSLGDAPFFRRLASRIPFKDSNVKFEELEYFFLGREVIQYLGDLKDKQAVPILTPMLLSCRAHFVRETADSLVKIGAPEAVPAIVNAIFYHRQEIENKTANWYAILAHRNLVHALAMLGDESVVPLLKDIIWGGGPDRLTPNSASPVPAFSIRPERWRVVTPVAVFGLGRIAGPDSLLPLLTKQEDGDREEWRQRHIVTLENLQVIAIFVHDAKVRNALLTLMEKSPNPKVRSRTVEALSHEKALKIEIIRKAIIARLGDTAAGVRWTAVNALSNKDVVAHDNVKQALMKTSVEDPSERVREEADEALSL